MILSISCKLRTIAHKASIDRSLSFVIDEFFDDILRESRTASLDMNKWQTIAQNLKNVLPGKIAVKVRDAMGGLVRAVGDKANQGINDIVDAVKEAVSEKIDLKKLFPAFKEGPDTFKDEIMRLREDLKAEASEIFEPLQTVKPEDLLKNSKGSPLQAFKSYVKSVVKSIKEGKPIEYGSGFSYPRR